MQLVIHRIHIGIALWSLLFLAAGMRIVYRSFVFLRKVGVPSRIIFSREGCRVEVQDSRDEAGREFERLVIHRIEMGIALWTLSFWHRACELHFGISFLGIPQK